jgi:hypothetical protein
VDAPVSGALPQLQHGPRDQMNVTETQGKRPPVRRRVRNGALGLMSVALAFYFGIIALLIYRSHH